MPTTNRQGSYIHNLYQFVLVHLSRGVGLQGQSRLVHFRHEGFYQKRVERAEGGVPPDQKRRVCPQ